jgi:hypothetical protein
MCLECKISFALEKIGLQDLSCTIMTAH